MTKNLDFDVLLSYQTQRLQVHELTGDKLKIREVVQVDIANDPIAPADYRESEDPTK